MTQMQGADVGELRRLAVQFSDGAAQLRTTADRVGGGIRIAAWAGPAAVRFRVSWDTDLSRSVRAAADHLDEAARRLRQEADEQERASSPSGLAATGGVQRDGLSDAARRALDVANGLAATGGALKGGLEQVLGYVGPGIDLNKAWLETAGRLDDHPWLKNASKVTGGLGLFLGGFDLAAGVVKQDWGQAVSGAGGLALGGLAIAGGAAAAPAVAVGGATVFVGSQVLPVGESEIDGAYDYMMRQEFGSSWDPDDPTPEQAAWAMENSSGPGGFFRVTGSNIAYKTGETVGFWSEQIGRAARTMS